MAQRFETDGGTAFQGSLTLIDQDGEVLAVFDGETIAALTPLAGGADLATTVAAYNALLAAFQA